MGCGLIVTFVVIFMVSDSYQNSIFETVEEKINAIKETIVNTIQDEIQAKKCKNCIVKSPSRSRHEPSHGKREPEKVDTNMKMENLKRRCDKKRNSKACLKHLKHLGPAASPRQLPVKKRQPTHNSQQEGSCSSERMLINGTGHICCNGTQFRVPELQSTNCCGSQPFNTRTHVCCAGVIHKAHGASNVKGKCCGSVYFYRNCYKCKRPENVLVFRFDVKQRFCCAGRVLKIRGQRNCCNDTIYNPSEYVCLNEILHRVNFSLYPELEKQGIDRNKSDILPAVGNTTGNDVVAMLPPSESDSDQEGNIPVLTYIAIGGGCFVLVAVLSIAGVCKFGKLVKRESGSSLNDVLSYWNPGTDQDASEIQDSENADLIEDINTRGGLNADVVQRRADIAYTLLPDRSFDGVSRVDSNCSVTNSAIGQGNICSSQVFLSAKTQHRRQENNMTVMSDTSAPCSACPINTLVHAENNQRKYFYKNAPPTANTTAGIQGNIDLSCGRELCGSSGSSHSISQYSVDGDAQISKSLSTSLISIKMEPVTIETDAPDENAVHFNTERGNTEEEVEFPSSEIGLHLRHCDQSDNPLVLPADRRNEGNNFRVNCNSLSETMTKSSSVSEKNMTTSLFSDNETQTSPEKIINKRNIFCRNWDFRGQFGERGGTLQQHKDSSVQLIIQPNSVMESTFIDVYCSTYAQIPEMRRTLSIPDDEEIASVGVEYLLSGQSKLLQYAVVKMKYMGNADELKVYWFKSNEGASDKTETNPVEPRSKENVENQEMFFTVGEDGYVYVYTNHFSGFVCTQCAKVTYALYPYVFGSYQKFKSGLRQVSIRMHLLTLDIYSIHELFEDLKKTESASSRTFRDRHEIILATTAEPQSQLKFELELDVDDEDRWTFKYHPKETTWQIENVVRCHPGAGSNARVDWFLESKPNAAASPNDDDRFGCCIKINEEQVQHSACESSFIVIPSMEPESHGSVMMKDPLDKRRVSQPVQVTQHLPTTQVELACSKSASESGRAMLPAERVHAELACTRENFEAGRPMVPDQMNSSICGPPANIAVKFPVQENGDVHKTDGNR